MSPDGLYVARASPIHRLPAHVAILSTLAFLLVVVLTPAQLWPAFLGYALIVTAGLIIARVPPHRVRVALLIEVPFLLFALLLPFLGREPDVAVMGMDLSQPGLWAAWNILAKATIAILASTLLTASTTSTELLAGLGRLHVPAPLVNIASFMLRYAPLVNEERVRMARARAARGFTTTGPGSWSTQARGAGVLFVRSFERGERVHQAMLARGYRGAMPSSSSTRGGATRSDLVIAVSGPALAAVVAITALLVGGMA